MLVEAWLLSKFVMFSTAQVKMEFLYKYLYILHGFANLDKISQLFKKKK